MCGPTPVERGFTAKRKPGRPPRDRAGEDRRAVEALEQWLQNPGLRFTRKLTPSERELLREQAGRVPLDL